MGGGSLQELYSQFKAKEDVYSQLLAKGRLMLLNRDDSGSGSKTEQSVALLEQKWCLVSTKMEERKVTLGERCIQPCPTAAAPCLPLCFPTQSWGLVFWGFFFYPSLLVVKAESVFQVVLGVKLSAWGFFSR